MCFLRLCQLQFYGLVVIFDLTLLDPAHCGSGRCFGVDAVQYDDRCLQSDDVGHPLWLQLA
jgi:hypothetical protein